MNVSRSGRIRKKSKFLTDSEFHTPKDSVIYGLSNLVTKHSAKENVETLEKPSDGFEKAKISDESKLLQYGHELNN